MRTEVIGTSRLSLCSASAEDFPALFERVFSDAEVMRHVVSGQAMSLQAAEAFYAEKFDAHASGQKPGVLVERSSAQVIGFSGLMRCTALGENEFELGFVLARQAWGKGYAQEIGHAQLRFGFAKLKCGRLLAQVSPSNGASIAVLSKIGMQLHSTIQSPGRGTRHVYVANAA
jgi:ribosomal-protein-alanine N-acetyltransferase